MMYCFELHESITMRDDPDFFTEVVTEILLPTIPSAGTVLYFEKWNGTTFEVEYLEIMIPEDDDDEEDGYSYILHRAIELDNLKAVDNYIKCNRQEWSRF